MYIMHSNYSHTSLFSLSSLLSPSAIPLLASNLTLSLTQGYNEGSHGNMDSELSTEVWWFKRTDPTEYNDVPLPHLSASSSSARKGRVPAVANC